MNLLRDAGVPSAWCWNRAPFGRGEAGVLFGCPGESEAAVVGLLRGPQRAPGPCRRCTRSFGAGSSVSYGGGSTQRAGWTVSFARSR